MTDTEIVIVLGTRPEIIKLAPVVRACETNGVPYSVVHTGQHYSEELDAVFFEQLELPDPDYNLEVGSDSHGVQTAAMLVGIEEILQEEQPDTVLVQGDTNSVLAGAIATSKMDIDLGHVEAGLRSFDREMPEEINRVMTDHAADYLFAPTDDSAALIRDEGIPADRIHVTGNTVVDAVEQHREFAQKKSSVLEELELQRGEYVLMTAHRAENVDDPNRFERMFSGVSRVADRFGTDVVYPIHPRAKNRIEEFDLSVPRSVRLVEPQDYLDFLNLESHARLILTDSGGVQEEACILGVPCVTMRDNTERPETIDVGANVLAGTDADEILESAVEIDQTSSSWESPFGDGTSANKIINTIVNNAKEPAVITSK